MQVQTEPKTDGTPNPAQAAMEPQGQEPKDGAGTNQELEGQEPEDLDWNPKQRAYLEDLRKENAKHRTKAKDLESKLDATAQQLSKIETGFKNVFGDNEDTLTPEEQLEQVKARNEALELNQAISETADEYGVTGEDKDYFRYLLTQELQGLGEDEEISEEQLETIAKKAKARSASSTTSVDDPEPTPGS